MNIMDHGRMLGILDRLQSQLSNDPGEFERTLDYIEEVI